MNLFDNLINYSPSLILLALVIELLFGWPRWLFKIAKHPVVWIGALISVLEQRFNRTTSSASIQKCYGTLTALFVIFSSTLVAWAVSYYIPDSLAGLLAESFFASSLLAARSLYEHVTDVSKPLAINDVSQARVALAKIVGRDTKQLDEPGVAGAALESLAENASDGVIAPIFWGVLFGLPGLVAYKAINTLDSMIGHKSTRYLHFGAFAAHLDDVANWVPARITAGLIWCCGHTKCVYNAIAAEAKQHRSPNAGWPESAMAFALGVKLCGPRHYASDFSHEPWLNAAGSSPDRHYLQIGLKLYCQVVALTAGLLFIASLTVGST